MLKVVITAFPGAMSSAIAGVADLLVSSGVIWNVIQGDPHERYFSVRIASEDGKPVRCVNGIELSAHMSFAEIDHTDILIVPTIASPISEVLTKEQALQDLLRRAAEKDWTICGNCTGNFLLANAGILNGRRATTHWGYRDTFAERYPEVLLAADQLITRDGDIYCAGGGLSWFDLTLHLIERFVNHEVAMQTAKAFVFDYRRDSQLSYSLMRLSKPHKDDRISEIQAWLDDHYASKVKVDELASQFGMSKRTLIRRFNSALAMSPNTYIQTVRIEAARKLLEETDRTVDVVMNEVGYEDGSSFRRLFRSKTGLTPTEYRRRFSRRL
ncbi:MAG: AraC family transcriptional regulator [Thalassolituus sp.]|jgi:transcriptional regulator GlxA family with amidase domain|uniref:Helix-turn-helix domain-containing protein n=1 Tax=Thalassolituus maritimus TaxID=484498 RepID=A0ABP9ZVE2_9GAMM|nr:GlxA family transcriptional regulator [Pseudomonadota bacterium]MEC8524093.1 GlxA family transcriptional regulator [Pseudomonadota bacterium]MEE2749346.1 GlxA family transcriptional regulator [Pseudomonadota bacterium]TNC85643.1 MAG: AraC family transcriptional regulator [Thalassolituus sp.]|tara:strand:- start:442 stop:1422 length:981 start_codon:yes stop_codon:yes gene_type:complete